MIDRGSGWSNSPSNSFGEAVGRLQTDLEELRQRFRSAGQLASDAVQGWRSFTDRIMAVLEPGARPAPGPGPSPDPGPAKGADGGQVAQLKQQLQAARVDRQRALTEKKLIEDELEEARKRLKKVRPRTDSWGDDSVMDTLPAVRSAEEVERLKDENRRLSGELDSLSTEKKDLMDKLQAAEEQRQSLTLRVGVLEAQLKELEQFKKEKASLVSEVEQAADLKKKVEELAAENLRLRSAAVVKQKPARPTLTMRPEGVGGSLQLLLENLCQFLDTRGAVLADLTGLPVAGVGKHVEALAAMAAVFPDTADKVEALLPLAGIRTMTMADESDLTFTAQLFPFSSENLILTTLTVGDGPDPEEVDRLASKVLSDRNG